MKLAFAINWQFADGAGAIDPRLLQLLVKIDQHGSLQKAAEEVGVSYRTAWQIIEHWNAQFSMPLCTKNRGRGTRLTQLGEKLVSTKQKIDATFSRSLQQSADALNEDIAQLASPGKKQTCLIAYTSHDLAVQGFAALCEDSKDIAVEFVSRGSLDALKQLYASELVIAGFHFPDGPIAQEVAADYRPLLDDRRFGYIHLAQRQQGLMFRSSQKKHIRGIADLTRRSLTFINRQKGSGTRTIFDHLLQINDLNPRDINGYKCEEFTHTAVAAMVSSNHADVGFGLKAAAVEFELQFLPLLEESYILAYHKLLPATAQNELRRLLKHNNLKKQIARLPGYSSAATGKTIHADKLLTFP
ncbi:MAG: substrate-binding domain-containing protein [Gammaproteobacteria bacterium]